MDALIINETVPPNESSTEDPYDCGWGDIVTAAAVQATDESAWVIYKAISELTGRVKISKLMQVSDQCTARDRSYRTP
jgi:hypothetical protein